MSWEKRTHLHCSLVSKVREGSEKTSCSASGFYWLILKANEIQEQGAHDEKHFWSLSYFSSNKLHISRFGPKNKEASSGNWHCWIMKFCPGAISLMYTSVVLSSVLWNPPGVKPCILWKPVLKLSLGGGYLYVVFYCLSLLPPIFSLFSMGKSVVLFWFTMFIVAQSCNAFSYLHRFFYLNVKWGPCSLTGDYNSDCRTDAINSNKGASPFEFCHTFYLSVPSSFPVYQMLRMCPWSYIGLLCILSVLGLLSALLDLCFVSGVHVLLLFLP